MDSPKRGSLTHTGLSWREITPVMERGRNSVYRLLIFNKEEELDCQEIALEGDGAKPVTAFCYG